MEIHFIAIVVYPHNPSSAELCFTAELRLIAPKHHTWLHDTPRLASIKYGQTGTQTSIIGGENVLFNGEQEEKVCVFV